jgi:predicted Fe-Mo cluster-binding NifX family protein
VDSAFDMRFGRAAWFCLYDKDSGKLEFYENHHANSNHGAGTKAAEKMIELGVEKVISGDFGPKAKELLDKFNIQMVILQDDGLTIGKIIEKLKS